jgi:hypothetical protein
MPFVFFGIASDNARGDGVRWFARLFGRDSNDSVNVKAFGFSPALLLRLVRFAPSMFASVMMCVMKAPIHWIRAITPNARATLCRML